MRKAFGDSLKWLSAQEFLTRGNPEGRGGARGANLLPKLCRARSLRLLLVRTAGGKPPSSPSGLKKGLLGREWLQP